MRRLTFIMAISILLLSILSCTAPLSTDENEMVYLTGDKLEYVYGLLQDESFDYKKTFDDQSVTIVKESITPMYTLVILEYAKTKKLNIVPMDRNPTIASDGELYSAKLIDSQGEFIGNLIFRVKDGVAYHYALKKSNNYPNNDSMKQYYDASYSYADHAKRIQTMLDKNEIIPPDEVKLVAVDGIGVCFYLKKDNLFIPTGMIKDDETNTKPIDPVDWVISIESLNQLADEKMKEYNDFIAVKEQWEKENPGEKWLGSGPVGIYYYISCGCSEVNNIINIHEYLNISWCN